MVHPFVSAPNIVSVIPSMGVLFPILRSGKVSTLWSRVSSVLLMVSYILGILNFWANIQFAKCTKLKKNEDQSVDTLPFLRIGNKTPMEGVTETKFGTDMKGWII